MVGDDSSVTLSGQFIFPVLQATPTRYRDGEIVRIFVRARDTRWWGWLFGDLERPIYFARTTSDTDEVQRRQNRSNIRTNTRYTTLGVSSSVSFERAPRIVVMIGFAHTERGGKGRGEIRRNTSGMTRARAFAAEDSSTQNQYSLKTLLFSTIVIYILLML